MPSTNQLGREERLEKGIPRISATLDGGGFDPGTLGIAENLFILTFLMISVAASERSFAMTRLMKEVKISATAG